MRPFATESDAIDQFFMKHPHAGVQVFRFGADALLEPGESIVPLLQPHIDVIEPSLELFKAAVHLGEERGTCRIPIARNQADDDSIVDEPRQGRCDLCEENLCGELNELLSPDGTNDGHTAGEQSRGDSHAS